MIAYKYIIWANWYIRQTIFVQIHFAWILLLWNIHWGSWTHLPLRQSLFFYLQSCPTTNSQSSASRFKSHMLTSIKQQMCLFILGSWSLWWFLNADWKGARVKCLFISFWNMEFSQRSVAGILMVTLFKTPGRRWGNFNNSDSFK